MTFDIVADLHVAVVRVARVCVLVCCVGCGVVWSGLCGLLWGCVGWVGL